MINSCLCSGGHKADLSFAFLIDGNVAEVYRKVKKHYCKVDKIYDKNVVDVSADYLSCDASDISGYDKQQEGKTGSLGGS